VHPQMDVTPEVVQHPLAPRARQHRAPRLAAALACKHAAEDSQNSLRLRRARARRARGGGGGVCQLGPPARGPGQSSIGTPRACHCRTQAAPANEARHQKSRRSVK